MKLVKSVKKMQEICRRLKREGKTIGFVPTMGFLHAGHLSLVRRSVKESDRTVMSIYVNPLQFGPKEDFKKYPRNLKQDINLVKNLGVDYIFTPEDKEMYPENYLTTVGVAEITEVLCGALRPGHFRGVTTVVVKLFNIVLPDCAYFGQKDAQQAVVIKKMVKDLNMPLRIKVLPIVREPDGLAMSSRNIYLSRQERTDAAVLYKSLQLCRKLIQAGERNSYKIILAMKRLISRVKSAKIDYICIVDADDLSEEKNVEGKVLIALAVFIGKTRLIDNLVLKVK